MWFAPGTLVLFVFSEPDGLVLFRAAGNSKSPESSGLSGVHLSLRAVRLSDESIGATGRTPTDKAAEQRNVKVALGNESACANFSSENGVFGI